MGSGSFALPINLNLSRAKLRSAQTVMIFLGNRGKNMSPLTGLLAQNKAKRHRRDRLLFSDYALTFF